MARDRLSALQLVSVAVCLWTIQIQTQSVMADYVLEIKLTAYNNPTNECEGCKERNEIKCCDSVRDDVCDGGFQRCDNQFHYCLRPLNTSSPTGGCIGYNNTVMSNINWNAASINFSLPTVLGLPNPMNLTGMDTFWRGVQLYIEVLDYDPRPNHYEFVDSFSMNMNESTTKGLHVTLAGRLGTYGWATIGLTARFLCAENYYGELCERFYFCSAAQINCSGHGVCSNLINGTGYSCDCKPDYTGDFYSVDVRGRPGGSSGGIIVGVVGGLVAVIITVLLILLVVLVVVAVRKRQVHITKGITLTPPSPYTVGDNPVYGIPDTVTIKHSDKSNTVEFDNPIYNIEGPEYETPITTRQPTTYETIPPLYSTSTEEHTEQSTGVDDSDTDSNTVEFHNHIYGDYDIEGPEYAILNTTGQPTAYDVPTPIYSTVTDDVRPHPYTGGGL